MNHARGEWQISRADLGFAYEAMARASAVAGERAEADRYAALAHGQATEVTEDDDREVLLNDLATLP